MTLPENNHYDLIILDIMLPKMDGFEVIKTLRTDRIDTPVLMLTAKSTMSDKVSGLNYGADGYNRVLDEMEKSK